MAVEVLRIAYLREVAGWQWSADAGVCSGSRHKWVFNGKFWCRIGIEWITWITQITLILKYSGFFKCSNSNIWLFFSWKILFYCCWFWTLPPVELSSYLWIPNHSRFSFRFFMTQLGHWKLCFTKVQKHVHLSIIEL